MIAGVVVLVMGTQRWIRFVNLQIAWMLFAVLLLAAVEGASLELFFSLSLLGLFVIAGITTPFSVVPEWRRRLQWLIVLGTVVFAFLVFQRVLDIAGGVSPG
ncbi:hypothetical protein [Natronorubrum halophilum]|uniref:hypothetical protein n=1 Tax=Natronorubrum halophilum TaxID=1702106 RepID=UPI001EE92D9B|nr:hypothetical protein [Natronorubrum halophilum]